MRKIQTETRVCLECREEYEWNARNIYCLCARCRKRHYRKSQKLSDEDYKKPYPLPTNEKRVRYRRLQKELDNTTTAEERRAIYSRELDYMIQSGIFEWCTDLRIQIIQRPGSGKKGRKPHTDSKSEYPNTKDWYD
jgi:hypothetical protein